MTKKNRMEDNSVALAEEAAARLFNFGDTIYEPEDSEAASAAVEQLGRLFTKQPHVINKVLEGSGSSGKLLSSNRLQGLAEILQNADDTTASEVRLVLREYDLLVGHNGDPVRLRHVLGLATPWFSTKGDEAELLGRFGIGLSALRALSSMIDVHCYPYHLRLGAPMLTAITPIKLPEAFGGRNWTIFRIPLDEGLVELKELDEWLASWGDDGLLFLRNVSEVTLLSPAGAEIRRLVVSRERTRAENVSGASHHFDIQRHMVKASGRRTWAVYTGLAPSPHNANRVRKAKKSTTAIDVAFPMHSANSGMVYAGLPVVQTPFPILVNAQFDPLTSREELADTDWNRALVPLVAEVWAFAAIDLFRRNPVAAWCAMPVRPPSSDDAVLSLVERLNGAILDSARTSVAEGVAINVPKFGWLKLGELAVESKPLEGIVTEEETAMILGKRATLPLTARDVSGRWREVLRDWRDAGADLAAPLAVEQALTLLEDESRPVRSSIALAAAGVREKLDDQLKLLPCMAASDEKRIVPPADNSVEAMAKEVAPLAKELGIIRLLHVEHLEETDEARVLMAWLREHGAVLEPTDDIAVIRHLAAAGRSGRCLEIPLTDSQLDALRRAFELVDAKERQELGHDLGKAVKLSAYKYQPDRRRTRRKIVVVPQDAYLPRSIDGGKDTFAFAAGKAPDIVWLDGRYGKKLKSAEGRSGVGARRLLTLLGAETAPRPEPHPDLIVRYWAQPLGLAKMTDGSPVGRRRELDGQGATYTLSDSNCPAMIATVEDIARIRRGSQRRSRAAALLASIGRAWGRLSDYTEVDSAEDYRAWQPRGRTAAFWVWQMREVAWLDDESGKARCPGELRIRTSGTEAIFGVNSPDFLHPDLLGKHLEKRNWQAAMGALGLTGEPTRRDLVASLRDLRDVAYPDEVVARNTVIIYRALAESLLDSPSRSDLSRKDLKKAFKERGGLVFTSMGWRLPSDVFAGPPVFGRHMPFAPQIADTDQLWEALGLRKPSLEDCITVLRRIARRGHDLSIDDEGVHLETLRLAVNLNRNNGGSDVRRKLGKLPLWTTQGWKRDRPVFATEDEALGEAIGNSLPLWKPGGELEQFRALLDPLRVEVMDSGDVEIVDADSSIEEPGTTKVFVAAIEQLREDLVRNEPSAAQSLHGDWDDLRRITVWSHPNLMLAVRVPESVGGGIQHFPVHVRVDESSGKVFARNPERDLPRSDRGGRALATMFDGERRHVAQAWRSAWDRAEDGIATSGVELAQQKAKREQEEINAQIKQDLEALQARTGGSSIRTTDRLEWNPRVAKTDDETDARRILSETEDRQDVRVLVDPELLEVIDSSGQVVGSFPRTSGKSPSREGGLVDPSGTKPNPPQSRKPLRGYSDLERETVGFELAKKVLSSDHEKIIDLRAKRGVGADAMDELKRFYELKVSAGGEPNEITLTNAEWQRAQTSDDFFLVVVSGVEGAVSKPNVRIIPRPLEQLETKVSGSLILSGVRDAKSVTYSFAPVATDSGESAIEMEDSS